MLIETITARAKRRYTRDSLPSSQWEDLIARAVTEYSRWNPYETETTVTTVADQSDYEVEDDCIAIEDVAFDDSLTITSTDNALETGVGAQLTMPSHGIIDDINQDEYYRQTTPKWTWLPGARKLRIDPTPDGVDTVYVRYYAKHMLDEEEAEYATIPDDDLDIIVDLALYELYGDRGFEMSLEPNYTAGLEREDFGDIQRNIATMRDSLLHRVRAKYGGTGGVLWP